MNTNPAEFLRRSTEERKAMTSEQRATYYAQEMAANLRYHTTHQEEPKAKPKAQTADAQEAELKVREAAYKAKTIPAKEKE